MLLKKYEDAGYLINSNLKEACSGGKLTAYRGELIVVEGEMLDSSGRRKPPQKVLQQAAVLADENQLKFVTGLVEDVADIPTLLERYGKDMAADTLSMIFVVNIDKPAIFSSYTSTVFLLPMDDGLPWSELMQFAGLEKADIKSLSSPDKVQAIYRELASFRPRGAVTVALADVPALSNGKQREMRGAV